MKKKTKRCISLPKKEKKYYIICLQDVHLEEKMELYVKSKWGFRLYMSPYKSNYRGVMVLINNTPLSIKQEE